MSERDPSHLRASAQVDESVKPSSCDGARTERELAVCNDFCDGRHSFRHPFIPHTPHKLPPILTGCIKSLQRVRGSHLKLISGNYGGRGSDEELKEAEKGEREKKTKMKRIKGVKRLEKHLCTTFNVSRNNEVYLHLKHFFLLLF